ncbi:hypothetical protein EJ08DRAFT_653095 [Tothia fuscella]|uniref:DUF7730 domain-containing protein n=1 Tax=Tothia fuscella TaxID=1048955 RepID=A0A9P4TTH9_9PEZI|nr:hypothetical protein EJ08DRAFT_653095 [Tothia fuscella]
MLQFDDALEHDLKLFLRTVMVLSDFLLASLCCVHRKPRSQPKPPHFRPPVLPYSRDRALTIQDDALACYGSAQLSRQEQSSLFRLPPELRQVIFTYALEILPALHVANLGRKLGYGSCSDHDLALLRWRWAYGFGTWMDGPRPDHLQLVQRHKGGTLLALLMTCRLIYAEGIRRLYSMNKFHFTQLASFNYFTESILSSRRNTIRSIAFDLQFSSSTTAEPFQPWEHTAAATIKRMQGLRRVIIHVTQMSHLYHAMDGTIQAKPPIDTAVALYLRQLPELDVQIYQVSIIASLSTNFLETLGETSFEVTQIRQGPNSVLSIPLDRYTAIMRSHPIYCC